MIQLRTLGRFLSGIKGVYNELNPATLTGALDVVIVEDSNGTFKCGPFHVRFGKMGTINPADKSVEVYINGELVTSLHMRLGSAGYAYFVDDAEAVAVDSDSESASVPVDNSEVQTPLFRMRSAEDLTDSSNLTMSNRRRRRKARKDAPVSENHPDHFTFESTSFTPNELQPPSPPTYLSDNECERLQSSTFNTILESSQQEPRTNDPSPVPTTSFDSPTQLTFSKDISSSPVRSSTKEAHVSGSPGVYLEDLVTTKVDESIKQAYLYMTTSKNRPNDQYSSQELNAVDAGYRSDTELSAQQSVSSLNLVRELKLSLCGGLSADSQVNEESFYASLVTFEDFSKDPAGIISNPNLVLFLNGKYYNWGMGAPLLLSYICFQTELPYSSILRLEQDFMPKKRPRRKAWFSWGTTEPETTKPELGKTEDPVSNIHANEVTREISQTLPVPEALNGNNKNEEKKDRPHRKLRLTSEEVLNLGLKPGVNSAEFRIVTKFQGTYSCSANIYLWRSDDQLESSGSPDEVFSRAASYLQEVANSLTSDQLLFFYARFKQATEGVCNKPDPGFLQPKARQKWRAWKALADMPPEVAQREYVDKMNEVAPDWSLSSNCSKPQVHFGPRVSRPVFSEEGVTKTDGGQLVPLIELVKDGELEPVNEFLKLHPDSVREVDSEGMTALHWACDRGFYEIVLTLLSHGANVNAITSDGQSPLHFASCCEHEQVTRLLLDRGADKNLRDADGDTPSLQFLSQESR
nr:unnamed protein product [Spirometra erinaceieuropaei]